MGWCISSLGSLCLSQRINIWESGHQNDWVHLKVQEAAESRGAGCDYKHLGIFFFFVLSLFCISFLSFRKTYDVSYWSDCFLKQCSWFSQPIKEKDWSGPRVSVSQSGWGPARQRPRDLRCQDTIESRYSSVKASQNHQQVILLNTHGLALAWEI